LTAKEGFMIMRERIFIIHNSAKDRTIKHEYTLLNLMDNEIPSIFLPLSEFMIGLKVYDESGKELPIYTNDLTKKVLSVNKDFESIIKDIEERKQFLVWIKLPENEKIRKDQSKIIKLQYKNVTPVKMLKFTNSLHTWKKLKFLFSVPRFRTIYTKLKGFSHDIFYIFSIPEDYELDYEIKENVRLENDKPINLTKSDGVYINGDNNNLSIRIPPFSNATSFNMIYDVIPEKGDRIFYAILVFFLIGLSTSFSLIGTQIIDTSIIPFNHIYFHINTLLGGIITVSLASIGFMKKCATNRTRLWLIFPIIISSIGFLLKDIFK